MTVRNRVRAWLGRDINPLLLAGAIGLAAWPFLAGDAYSLRLLTMAGIYALAAIGYQFIFGHAGALSLAQGAFFGFGAYVAGIMSVRMGAGFEVTFPAAMAGSAVLAALVALPALRLRSHYFALATLGFGQVVLLIAVNWENVTGGANGIPNVPVLSLFGGTVGRGWPMLMLVWSLVAIGALVARRLTGGLTGAALILMREQPMAAEAAGIDIRRIRFAAFLLSALYGGAAGALHVHTVRVVSPEVLEFPVMVMLLAIAVIGGRTSVAGAVVGAVLLIHLPEWFRPLERYYLMAYGAVLLAMIVAAPWGLMGSLRHARRRWLPEPDPPLPAAGPTQAGPSPARLEIMGLTRHFGGVRAVDGIDLVVEPGESVGIVGANGSGKTTVLNMIAGTDRPDSGHIGWAGTEIVGLPPYRINRAGIARSFQTLKLVDEMTVLDNVAAAAWREFGRTDRDSARAAAMGLLQQLDVAQTAWRPCGALPPGLRRRVEIARALIGGPALLLLDEPAAGLTAAERDSLARTLAALNADGTTVVVVEHDLAFLERFVARIVCFDQGRIIADGAPAAVRADPGVIAAWLGQPPGEGDDHG
ncbi:MAG: branched-chain amino acid ABC transporter ATP-binding protein/permease [Alphaproteobacteria bacterium]|nr:branched-chain amino acid ABC transporter ATP-binding protein/permease [Alphaproteobacteria bacterium]